MIHPIHQFSMKVPSVPEKEQNLMRAEIARLPLNSQVKARGCSGLGVGTVLAHITYTENKHGTIIPYRGFVDIQVFFPDDFEGYVTTFRAKDLIKVK